MEPNPQNIVNQPVPPADPNKHLNLLPTIIVGTLMLLLGLGSGYLLFANKSEIKQAETTQAPSTTVQLVSPTSIPSSTTDPTADWKTLSNTEAHFSLKMPEAMKAIGVGINSQGANFTSVEDASDVLVCNDCDEQNYTNFSSLYIRTIPLAVTTNKDKPFDQIVNANYQANIANKNNTNSVIKTLESITFAGEKAFTYTLNSTGYSGSDNGFATHKGINKIIEVEHQGVFYIFIFTSDQTFDQIISTFKFTQ